jgi:hypothetical protein
VIDLGIAPPSNAYLEKNGIGSEPTFPLRVLVCDSCWLVQTEDFIAADSMFNENYAYFSSTSTSWLEKSELFVERIIPELQLTDQSLVIEIASNDGYLLEFFEKAHIPNLGIEPTKSTAEVAISKGIKTRVEFFTTFLAKELAQGGKADLIIGINVLAHVPDINDFVSGSSILLSDHGTIIFEFPHVQELIVNGYFDTIYHEHFSYLSVISLIPILKRFNLEVYKINSLETHGGSLQLYIGKIAAHPVHESVSRIVSGEEALGVNSIDFYSKLDFQAKEKRRAFLDLLSRISVQGKTIAGYGAAAKGNTLLNYCGLNSSSIEYICDAAEEKQGKLTPGSHIPIENPNFIFENSPDYVIVLPWNLSSEVEKILQPLRDKGTKLIQAFPEIKIF